MVTQLTTEVTIRVEDRLLEEAQERVGPEGLPEFMNEALRYYLQALRFREVEAELAAKHGPISEETKKRVAELEWIV
jgi:Arc/MetJ family transcription regulator